jgi:two-component system phosphate regulon sensor histidine kinase PhoR
MKKTVFLKNFFGYLLTLLILSISILLFSFATIRNHYIKTLTNDLKNLGAALQLRVVPFITTQQYEDLGTLVKALGTKIGTRITIIAPDGIVLADSEKDPQLMDNHGTRLEVIQALELGMGQSIRFSRTVKQEMLYVAQPIIEDGTTLGIVRVSLFLSDINSLLNDLKIKIVMITTVIIVIALAIAFFFSKGLSKPIGELATASRQVAAGDFDTVVLSKRKDELGELAESFNYMVSQIKNLVSELSREKEALNTIVASIHEGILVMDKKAKIILSNNSLKKITGHHQVDGKFLWEIVREPAVARLIENIETDKATRSEQIEIGGRYFICNATFMSAAEQILLTMHDITEISNIAKMKKDLVLNVSHELRTPLTAVKGYLETLEESVQKKNKHYLHVIKRHTERLINIVEDLLTLAQLEEKEPKLSIEKVDLKTLINNIKTMFEQNIKKKNLKLAITIDDTIPFIKADPFKMEQMFINIIDNAIKYTEKGSIKIAVNQENNAIKIVIEDTGIGIPEDHMPRIFERFYVVDKSRSRKIGGTGLGLSIVKHIVEAHRGTVTVKSEVNKGTTFTIILPR